GDSISPALKSAFGGLYIANEGFTKDSAETILENGTADAVAFGKLYIANPDLVERFKTDATLNVPDANTFYGDSGAIGYTDYPFLDSEESDIKHA
ncbi:MAG: alkene reductase, partial [Pseudomonadota bacterium]|nr:alkene reductase [Pseudomonadota bacterium]